MPLPGSSRQRFRPWRRFHQNPTTTWKPQIADSLHTRPSIGHYWEGDGNLFCTPAVSMRLDARQQAASLGREGIGIARLGINDGEIGILLLDVHWPRGRQHKE